MSTSSYLTPAEAAALFRLTESEVWRRLETGLLPAVALAECRSTSGEAIGTDYALLPPDAVRLMILRDGDQLEIEFAYCGGRGVARTQARQSLIRVLAPEGAQDVCPATVPMKQCSLVDKYIEHWPTIRRDLKDASGNGLSAFAKISGGWLEDRAVEWARARGKFNERGVSNSQINWLGKIHRMEN